MKGICKAQFWTIIELAEVFLIRNTYSKAEDNLEKHNWFFFYKNNLSCVGLRALRQVLKLFNIILVSAN